MKEPSDDAIAANAARVRHLLETVGAVDGSDETKQPDAGRVLAPLDDRSVMGVWSAWNS